MPSDRSTHAENLCVSVISLIKVNENVYIWAVVLTQLAKQSLTTPEDQGSNSAIRTFIGENKEKEARKGPFKTF